MALTLSAPQSEQIQTQLGQFNPQNLSDAERGLIPRIVVVGVGGAGSNAVDNMIRADLDGVEFIVANCDAQALSHSLAPVKIQLGQEVTQGLGAGSEPEVGKRAAQESLDEFMSHIQGAHMVFLSAGMGGGTGTGAAPVLAEAIRAQNILTVAVVTKPFAFEGQTRAKNAQAGLEALQPVVDTLITVPNQNLFQVISEKTRVAEAFKKADEVLYQGVRGISDLMVRPGQVNLDFADVRALMKMMGRAMMGMGEADGECRAVVAAEAAISNKLLEDGRLTGASGALINITHGEDATLFEIDEAVNRIREEISPDAHIIFGDSFDPNMDGRIRVSVVATGIGAVEQRSSASSTSQTAAEKPLFNFTGYGRSESQTAPPQQAPERSIGRARPVFLPEDEPYVSSPMPEETPAEAVAASTFAPEDHSQGKTAIPRPVFAGPAKADPQPHYSEKSPNPGPVWEDAALDESQTVFPKAPHSEEQGQEMRVELDMRPQMPSSRTTPGKRSFKPFGEQGLLQKSKDLLRQVSSASQMGVRAEQPYRGLDNPHNPQNPHRDNVGTQSASGPMISGHNQAMDHQAGQESTSVPRVPPTENLHDPQDSVCDFSKTAEAMASHDEYQPAPPETTSPPPETSASDYSEREYLGNGPRPRIIRTVHQNQTAPLDEADLIPAFLRRQAN